MLYKNRYLIALYDNNDEVLIGVYDNVQELAKSQNLNISSVKSQISRGNKRFFLIDAFEIVDDCFKEADEQTNKMFRSGELTRLTNRELAKKMGIPERTFYRKKKIKKILSGKINITTE